MPDSRALSSPSTVLQAALSSSTFAGLSCGTPAVASELEHPYCRRARVPAWPPSSSTTCAAALGLVHARRPEVQSARRCSNPVPLGPDHLSRPNPPWRAESLLGFSAGRWAGDLSSGERGVWRRRERWAGDLSSGEREYT
ncbi:hypothetical protein C2845_PM06G02640 [Panicum miliaceum]|uniref:Uncharacterized protein n=1 Tax=Panicum miliaceum TaxID=4540 RepID=A0A3L6RCD7_PANMI|nr:hypothetical protein C2845_PM06G02640 [Panicum miliaceum]